MKGKERVETYIPVDSMVSVLIRNHNEQEHIGFAIQSVLDFIPDAEIIVIDDNSTDDSLEVVRLFNNRGDISIHKIENYSPGRALNFGINLSKNDTVLILSAHAQITELDVTRVEELLTGYVAVLGKQVPIFRGKKITPRYIWSHFSDIEQINMFSKLENRFFLHNAFCFYRRDYLLTNPIDETLPGKEDRYYAADIVNKSKKSYIYIPSIKANHFYTKNGATWRGIG